MSWFKVDDKLWGHPKWLATPPRARALWITAGSWCAAQEQDGKVPVHVLPMLGASKADALALVASGLWEDGENGWVFHGWAEFQPTRAQQDEKREAARERMRKARERRANESENEHDGSEGVRANSERTSRGVRSTPTRPDPTPKSEPDGSDVSPARADVEALCLHLADRIEANGSTRPTITKGWRDAARRMLDIDGRTPEQVVRAIDWCQDDDFWRGNVLSMPKLREKYDQMRLQAARTEPRSTDRQGDLLRREYERINSQPQTLQIGA